MLTEVKNYLKTFLRMVYPASCVLCRHELDLDEAYLCLECNQYIQELKPPLCHKCSRELPPYLNKRVCVECRNKTTYFKRNWSILTYNQETKTILHLIKYRKKWWLLKLFQNKIRAFCQEKIKEKVDLIIPVPLHWTKKREREFNQSMVLAEILARVLNCQAKENILRKIRPSPPQSLLPRKERLYNLREAFSVTQPKSIKHKEILLVDDVFTTGTTVNECARVLKENGAKAISVFTLARAS